ncbi:hypothetical protein [Rhodococcus sp. P1Y]|uniref:hypothetical protein n=1 Tax=Rhodococcus sp. P1Y TaxID=1302308 RepID=UPI000EB44AA4|nr:hypothetical protein [Rhodococcus sp. P1Y]AYJ50830.1 hypothetical protein D8W71_23965 [Rhodococcus sp. P1Y]
MSATLVLGACGGAGTTTATAVLANLWALDGETAVAVDATVGGGDLVDRAADHTVSASTIETGLDDAAMSASSSGARVLGRSWLDAAEPDFERLDWYLGHRADVSLYDFGHRGFGRYGAHPVVSDPSATIVLTVPARPDAFGRAKTALQTISLIIGERAARRTSVVVTHQLPGAPVIDIAEMRRKLAGRARAVDEIPYDPHLGTGLAITASELAPDTTRAYERVRARCGSEASGTLSA